MVSNWFAINLARAVAARSTCIRYSLSPLVSPSLGLPWPAGFVIEVIVIFRSLRRFSLAGGRRNYFVGFGCLLLDATRRHPRPRCGFELSSQISESLRLLERR